MIDWHHPRIYERLRCFGLTLFTIGVASHNLANPPVAVAAIVVAILLSSGSGLNSKSDATKKRQASNANSGISI